MRVTLQTYVTIFQRLTLYDNQFYEIIVGIFPSKLRDARYNICFYFFFICY